MSISVGQRLSAGNNFDALRFFAASLVVVSHAFPLSYGSNALEPLMVFSGEQLTMGALAVNTFFVLSGALIAMSFQRCETLLQFVSHRALRLLPALAGMLLLANFVLGPMLTTYPLKEYFQDPRFFDHLANILILRPRYELPGVFEGLPWAGAICGLLWTLKYEVLCYATVAVLGVLGLLRPLPVLALTLACMGGVFVMDPEIPHLFMWMGLFRFFGAGILLYLWRNSIPIKGSLAAVSLIALTVGALFGGFETLFVVFGTYAVAYLGLSPRIHLENFGRHGDFSYGIYIYGFVAQQLASHWLGDQVTWLSNFVVAYPLTLLAAFLSWRLIEKPAMRLKHHFAPGGDPEAGAFAAAVHRLSEWTRLRPPVPRPAPAADQGEVGVGDASPWSPSSSTSST